MMAAGYISNLSLIENYINAGGLVPFFQFLYQQSMQLMQLQTK